MSLMKVLSIASFGGLIVACFFPWVIIPGRELVITGMNAEAINFGKPGLLHIVLGSIVILLLLLGKSWSLKTAFFVAAFNIAWAARNYFSLSACSGGVCPEKFTAIYMLPLLSVLAIIFLLLIRTPGSTKDEEALPHNDTGSV
jgi:hypothetical protein